MIIGGTVYTATSVSDATQIKLVKNPNWLFASVLGGRVFIGQSSDVGGELLLLMVPFMRCDGM